MNEKLKVYDTKMQKTMDSLDSEVGEHLQEQK